MPGVATYLTARRYDAVIKVLNGKLMTPLTLATAKARRIPFVLWSGLWHHPSTLLHRSTPDSHRGPVPTGRRDRRLW